MSREGFWRNREVLIQMEEVVRISLLLDPQTVGVEYAYL
jgi:hypothetical protein